RSSSASPRSAVPYSSRSAASSPAPEEENHDRIRPRTATSDILGRTCVNDEGADDMAAISLPLELGNDRHRVDRLPVEAEPVAGTPYLPGIRPIARVL